MRNSKYKKCSSMKTFLLKVQIILHKGVSYRKHHHMNTWRSGLN